MYYNWRNKMEGTVKWFNTNKGYGFIAGDDGEEYFVHFTALPRGMRLNENDRVSFESAETERGKQAKNVQLLGEGSAPEKEESSEEQPEEETQEEPAEESSEESSEEEPAEEPGEEKKEESGDEGSEEEKPAEEPKEETPEEEPKEESGDEGSEEEKKEEGQ